MYGYRLCNNYFIRNSILSFIHEWISDNQCKESSNVCCKANFASCAGTLKRIIRFKESKTYHFELISQLSKGELFVEILDSAKQPVLRLDGNNQSADIDVNIKQKYYMVFRFHSATGKYELSWG